MVNMTRNTMYMIRPIRTQAGAVDVGECALGE